MLSPGWLTLLYIPCADDVTRLPGAQDHLSEDALGCSRVHGAAGQHLLQSAEVGSALGRASASVVLGFKALPAHCPPAVAAADINFSQISASL